MDKNGRIADHGLMVHRGKVVSTGERVRATTYTGSANDRVEVKGTPEIWIKNVDGKEQRFCNDLYINCRVGHEVAIISKGKTDVLLGFRNISTGQTYYSGWLEPQKVDALQISITVVLALLAMVVTWIIAMLLFGGKRGELTFFGWLVTEIMFWGGIALSIWLPERRRRAREAERIFWRTRLDVYCHPFHRTLKSL